MEILAGSRWTYKGHEYEVFAIGDERGDLKVKDTNDSNWYDAVVYRVPVETKDEAGEKDGMVYISGTLFIRRLDDFQAKFKPV